MLSDLLSRRAPLGKKSRFVRQNHDLCVKIAFLASKSRFCGKNHVFGANPSLTVLSTCSLVASLTVHVELEKSVIMNIHLCTRLSDFVNK